MNDPTIQHGNLEINKIAFTFDDGPDRQPLQTYLDALEQCGARGTFFFTGEWLDKHPEQARELLARGHELALHSYFHRRMSQIPKKVFVEELVNSELAYQDVIGRPAPAILRFPYLDHNQQNLEWLQELGYLYIAGEDSGDWAAIPTEQIIENTKPYLYQGSIIFFHANDISLGTAQALKPLVREANQLGLQAVTISELLAGMGIQPTYRSWKITIEVPEQIAYPPEDWVPIQKETDITQLATESADWGIAQMPRGPSFELQWEEYMHKSIQLAYVQENRKLFSARRFADKYWGYLRAGVSQSDFVILDFAAKEAQADTLVYLLRQAAILAKEQQCSHIIARRDIRRLKKMAEQLGWKYEITLDR